MTLFSFRQFRCFSNLFFSFFSSQSKRSEEESFQQMHESARGVSTQKPILECFETAVIFENQLSLFCNLCKANPMDRKKNPQKLDWRKYVDFSEACIARSLCTGKWWEYVVVFFMPIAKMHHCHALTGIVLVCCRPSSSKTKSSAAGHLLFLLTCASHYRPLPQETPRLPSTCHHTLHLCKHCIFCEEAPREQALLALKSWLTRSVALQACASSNAT